MHMELHNSLAQDPRGKTGQELLKACVHCGFCLETCPTYLDTRDERDSPRGRIYLIQQLLATGAASEQTQLHLDRCLTCRSCETTCPSGMQYGALLDIGRGLVEEQVPRPLVPRSERTLLRALLNRPRLFAALLRLGQLLRPLAPKLLRQQIPPATKRRPVTVAKHTRRMLVLDGCVQGAATPNTNDAAKRVLDQLGISLQSLPRATCCGAVNYHLAAQAEGLDDMRRNIDAWWPHIEAGVEAIVSSASGCGAMVVEYGDLLAHDPAYAARAKRVSGLCRDLSEILLAENLEQLKLDTRVGKVSVHVPCSLQHALKLPHSVAQILQRSGIELVPSRDSHLCCGSAGTYSLLQADISERLKQRKLSALTAAQPDIIATANVGCQLQLQSEGGVPVVHWIELLDRQA